MGAGIRLALTRSLRSAATSPPSIAHNTRAALAGRVTPLECCAAKTAKMGAIRAQIRAMGADWQQLRGFGGFLVPARPARGVTHAAMQWRPGGEAVAALDGDPKRCGSPQIWATVGSNRTMYD